VSEAHSQTNFLNQGLRTDGDPDKERLAERIVDELRKIAGSDAKKDPAAWQGIDLNEIVAEVFVRLVDSSGPWNDRKHFYCAAAKAIRFLRVDNARRRKAMHLDSKIALDDPNQVQPGEDLARAEQLEQLDRALQELARVDPEAAEVIELYYFGVQLPADQPAPIAGQPLTPPPALTQEQIGQLINKSKATVCLRLRRGLDWLAAQLTGKSQEERT
jgi:RNA polymerase sigma factor (sigma-70 family)